MNKNSTDLSGFFISHANSKDPTRRILASALSNVNRGLYSDPQPLFWDATYFGLQKVKCFREAAPELQKQILQIANRDLLEEIYWVEQAGVGYMAKMVTLSQTHEERILYGLFTADEATHLAAIQQFLGDEPVFRGDGFLSYMGKLLESSDRALLMTLVQVVLEGWGLTHYRSLARHCRNPQLATTLQGFLEAESRHHALGTIQIQSYREYKDESLENIRAALSDFLYMVRVGPQRLLGAIAKVLGYMSTTQRVKILEELETEQSSNTRLQLLRSLMVGTVPDSILQSLEEQGSFQAYPANQCA